MGVLKEGSGGLNGILNQIRHRVSYKVFIIIVFIICPKGVAISCSIQIIVTKYKELYSSTN